MRAILNTIAAAALVGPLFVQPAAAGDPNEYPRLVGSGENLSVDYGPKPRGNIVGGGHVVATGSGENVDLHYADSTYVQRPPIGMVPTLQGTGENLEIVWVPAPEAWVVQSAGNAAAAGR
ncbi:hypothetical protein [Falsiroseomonas sp.]|uniref:hypothetical protein n=1 Tax=Falsiroseomonas sp. TaxID=2870721 RepID=UPI0035637131